jgi:uncharacterized delta-60 repeat protein
MKTFLWAALAILASIASSFGQAGSLDPTFGSGGITTTSFKRHAYGYAVAVQADQKIVVAGLSDAATTAGYDFALARYNSDGSIDPTFNNNGKVNTDFGSASDEATCTVIQPDGKIVAAGVWDNGIDFDFALARYQTNGKLDRTFSQDGKVTTNFGTNAEDDLYAVALQSDGKIVAAGSTHIVTHLDIKFAVARYNTNGSLDTTFGTGGKLTTFIGGNSCDGFAVVIQPDGKIIVGGDSYQGTSYDFTLARYNSNGSLDRSFGSGGIVTTSLSSADDMISALALQPDGKILAAGLANFSSSNTDFAVVRYTTDGLLDSTFGTNGVSIVAVTSGDDYCNAMALQPDGKIVLAGQAINAQRFSDFAVVRENADGTLDNSFGINGIVTTAIGTRSDDAFAVALQQDGKIIVAGDTYVTGPKVVFATARYLGGATP